MWFKFLLYLSSVMGVMCETFQERSLWLIKKGCIRLMSVMSVMESMILIGHCVIVDHVFLFFSGMTQRTLELSLHKEKCCEMDEVYIRYFWIFYIFSVIYIFYLLYLKTAQRGGDYKVRLLGHCIKIPRGHWLFLSLSFRFLYIYLFIRHLSRFCISVK